MKISTGHGHQDEERNVLEELLGGANSPEDDDDFGSLDRLSKRSAAAVSPPRRISATVSKTKKFEDALNKMKEVINY